MKSLTHENIVTLLDIDVYWKGNIDSRRVDLIFEYLEFGTLTELIREQRITKGYGLPYKKLLKYTEQLLSGLTYIHSYGYIHRDIKPGNILVSKNFDLKIADFGLCKFIT